MNIIIDIDKNNRNDELLGFVTSNSSQRRELDSLLCGNDFFSFDG
jgi:hypothetical protein